MLNVKSGTPADEFQRSLHRDSHLTYFVFFFFHFSTCCSFLFSLLLALSCLGSVFETNHRLQSCY